MSQMVGVCCCPGVTAVAAARAAEGAAPGSANPVGVVSNIKVLSDKVPNVSSLEAWKKSFIKEGMSDKEKALAIFRTEVTFQQADARPTSTFSGKTPCWTRSSCSTSMAIRCAR